MAITRVIHDIQTPEPLSRSQMNALAKASDEWEKAVGTSEIEDVDPQFTNFSAHLHVGDEGCASCVQLVQDEVQ